MEPREAQPGSGMERENLHGDAFDTACEELRDVGHLQLVRKLLAQRIIAAARRG